MAQSSASQTPILRGLLASQSADTRKAIQRELEHYAKKDILRKPHSLLDEQSRMTYAVDFTRNELIATLLRETGLVSSQGT